MYNNNVRDLKVAVRSFGLKLMPKYLIGMQSVLESPTTARLALVKACC